jgi:hypothetical protein
VPSYTSKLSNLQHHLSKNPIILIDVIQDAHYILYTVSIHGAKVLEKQMLRRVGAPVGAGRAAVGEDLGRSRSPAKEKERPTIGFVLVPLGLTVGRSLLQAGRSGSESRRGSQDQELVGATLLEQRGPRIATQGFGPQAMTAKLNIAFVGHPFNSGIWPNERSPL